MSHLQLTRASEFANRFRAYHLLVNGERVARVRNGKTIEIPIEAGSHIVELAIDWCRSNQIAVEIREGDTLSLGCGSNYTGWQLLRGVNRVMTDSQHYLWLYPEVARP